MKKLDNYNKVIPGLTCPNCVSETLVFCPTDDPEFDLVSKLSDGSTKWLKCTECQIILGKDKVTNSWVLSPKSYDLLSERGDIKDILE